MTEKSDHDLLVEIQTDLKWFRDSYLQHVQDNAGNYRELKNATISAHKRIDGLIVSGVLALIILALSVYLK